MIGEGLVSNCNVLTWDSDNPASLADVAKPKGRLFVNICPNFHTEWSNSCLQDVANQTLLPLPLPNCTANNFHCDWARWANQATQARQLFTSCCPSGLRRTGTASFRLSHVWSLADKYANARSRRARTAPANMFLWSAPPQMPSSSIQICPCRY